ncbi:MAG: RNA polymerase sigma factor, partial [Mucilaginibacter sp.]
MSGISNLDQLSARREDLFTALYKKAFPAVAKYVSRMGGSFDEAKDVFQDALVIYYEKTAEAKLTLNTSAAAYLVGSSKFLWIKRYQENCRVTSLDGIDISSDEKEESFSDTRIMHFLQTAGNKCMDLLKSFYYDHLSLSDAATL